MKLLMPEKKTLDSIEASVLNMARAQKSSHGATNLTGFLDQIQELIDKTMKTNILQRQNQTQLDLDMAWGNLSTCAHPNDTDYSSELKALDDAHSACRQEEGSIWSDYDKVCTEGLKIHLENKRIKCENYDGVLPDPAATCVMKGGTLSPTIGHYLIDMEKAFREKALALRQLRDGCQNASVPFPFTDPCGEKLCTYHDKKIECEKAQGAFEQRSCDIHKAYTCAAFSGCYSQKTEAYNGVVALARESEAAAKAEWRAVLRIECLLKALTVTEDEVDTAINACKAKSHSTEPVELTYRGDAPAARACEEVFLQPGSAPFSTAWYNGLPSSAGASSCASSCCMDGDFNPDYPSDVVCPYVAGVTTMTTTTLATTTAAPVSMASDGAKTVRFNS